MYNPDTMPLYNLFYADRNLHKIEYNKRFSNPETIHLDFMIGDNPAFFLPTLDFYRKMLTIERADKIVTALQKKLPSFAIDQFALRCLVNEIVLTNNIEGVHSTRKEITDIIENLSKNTKVKRFYGLVGKYCMLMNHEEIPLQTCQDIRNIYDGLFLDEMEDEEDIPDGEIFRKGPVSVYSATDKEIHHGIMPESAIISAMEKALFILHNPNLDLLFRVSVFHYLFGYIHPFYDGNGRTSRFISSYMLSTQYNHLISYRIASTIKENIKQYYKAFNTCNHPNSKGDLTPFVDMFLTIIELSMTSLRESLEERVQKLEHYRQLVPSLPHGGEQKMQPVYETLIQASLFSGNGISLRVICQNIGISETTLRNHLKKIPESLLSIHKNRSRYLYALNLNEIDSHDSL